MPALTARVTAAWLLAFGVATALAAVAGDLRRLRTAAIAYIPNGEVVGLSKMARTVEVFAKRFQLQERLTAQIADAFMDELKPKGVMVLVQAEHMCMTMRGIKKQGAKTVTVVTRGVFDDDERLRTDFYRMLEHC